MGKLGLRRVGAGSKCVVASSAMSVNVCGGAVTGNAAARECGTEGAGAAALHFSSTRIRAQVAEHEGSPAVVVSILALLGVGVSVDVFRAGPRGDCGCAARPPFAAAKPGANGLVLERDHAAVFQRSIWRRPTSDARIFTPNAATGRALVHTRLVTGLRRDRRTEPRSRPRRKRRGFPRFGE